MNNTYDGQVPTNPLRYSQMDLAYIKGRWDLRANRWDCDLKDSNCHLNRGGHYAMFIKIASKYLSAFPKDPVGGLVDMGCGTGCLLEIFAEHFPWAVGIDISSEMLHIAQDKLSPSITLIEGDVFEAKNVPDTISVAISRGVLLSHYGPENGRKLLSIIRNKITTDGIVIFDALGINAPDFPTGKWGYNHKMLEELARLSGFTKVIIEGKATDAMLVMVLQP